MINQIYNMDCLEGMKNIADGSIDCIVTSPPYNLGGDFHSNSVTYGAYNSFHDDMDEAEYQEWQVRLLNDCYRVLKSDGVMFYNHKNRIKNGVFLTPFEWIVKSKFKIMQVVVMDLKSTANVDKVRFFPVHELIFVLKKENETKLNNEQSLTDVWSMGKVPRKESGHPATFHLDLPRRCILAATKLGEIILDPFSGTGTTAVACLETGRNYIGYEMDSGYYKISQERIEKYNMQVKLF